MMGLLEGYYIPLYQWHYNPVSFDEKMDNMKLVFRLLQEADLPQPRSKPEGRKVALAREQWIDRLIDTD